MSHQVTINYTAIAIECISVCEVAKKQADDLDKMLNELQSTAMSLWHSQAQALQKQILTQKNNLIKKIDNLTTIANAQLGRGVEQIDSDLLRENNSEMLNTQARELQNQVNEFSATKMVEMHTLINQLLAEELKLKQQKMQDSIDGIVRIDAVTQELLDSIEDEVLRQFTYLAYLRDNTLSGQKLLDKGVQMSKQSCEDALQAEKERIRKELESFRIEKTVIDNIVNQDKSLKEIRTLATTEIVGEKVRQKSLKIIRDAITSRGFVVDSKNIRIDKQNNEVTMIALKASGEKAEFKVYLDGRFMYNFRGYEGQACQKDIEPFINDLEEVYGFNITKQTEIWSNPDKINTMKYQSIKTNSNKG